MSIRSRLLTCAALLAACHATAPASRAQDDATPKLPFVSNNGFDVWQPTANGDWPVDWSRGQGISWHREEGRAFLRLTQTEPGKLVMVYRDFAIPDDVKAFRFDTIARAANIVSGEKAWFDARIILQFLGDNKAKVKGSPSPVVIARKGTTDWKEVSKKFAVPEGATRIECMICLFQVEAGSMDVDLFNLEPISLEELNPPPPPPPAPVTPAAPPPADS